MRRNEWSPSPECAIKSVQEAGTPVVGVDGEPTSLAGLYTGNASAAGSPREPELPTLPRAQAGNGAAQSGNGVGKGTNGAGPRLAG